MQCGGLTSSRRATPLMPWYRVVVAAATVDVTTVVVLVKTSVSVLAA